MYDPTTLIGRSSSHLASHLHSSCSRYMLPAIFQNQRLLSNYSAIKHLFKNCPKTSGPDLDLQPRYRQIMDPIIIHFRKSTGSARRAVYHQIIDELSPSEWRDVKNRINERSFRKDILGDLPLELAVHIIRYLNLDDMHLLRRVSRRWHDVLSSKSACSTVFRLYTGSPLVKDFAGWSRRRLRLEKGYPPRRSQIDMPFLSGLSPDFSGGKYAYTTDGNTILVVFDLASGESQRFCTRHRHKFMKIRLSESIVAAITIRGYCHVWDLMTEKTDNIRLPNTDVSLFAASGFRIAMCFGSQVLHYDLRSQKTHTVLKPEVAYVGIATDLVMICFDKGNLRFYKYELQDDGTTVCMHSRDLPFDFQDVKIRYDLQDDCKNSMAVLHARQSLLILPVTYHPQTDKVCVHNLSEHLIARPLCIANTGKNILYWIKSENGRRSIWVSNPYADTPLYASRNMDLGLPRDPTNRLFLPPTLIGDSRFVSIIDATGTRVWHFEDLASLYTT
ncbi:hypothetical protein BJX70DRAFT_382321 [Aspergillus crustosus]